MYRSSRVAAMALHDWNGGMSDMQIELKAVRDELDRVDAALVGLVNDRARLAERIGRIKAAHGMAVYAPDREREVLDRVAGLNPGPMSDRALRTVYRELMSASLVLERAPCVALLGPEGSFSHLAVRRKFGAGVTLEFMHTITAVVEAVAREQAELAMAPVENSTVGGVGETLDALIDRDVVVCGEVYLAIHHHLLASGPLESITRIYTKPEVVSQCQKWLAETGFSDKVIPTPSTSAAAEQASREPGSAAIAGELAGERFGLSTVAPRIEDDPGNVTRFLILGRTAPRPTGSDKTSLVFSVGDEPGLLASALDVFRRTGINMTRIESRPNRHQKWSYWFFVDIDGHADTPDVADALTETAKRCSYWKVLGAYPRAVDTV
ncbi:MAG: prephenate dehydratase [Phycisphaerae bacterium]